MSANCVGWFEIYVQDMERAKRFYQAVFGQELQSLSVEGEDGGLEMWAFPWVEGAPGAAGALVHMGGVPSGGNSTLVYFGCDDCAVEEARVVPSGGTVARSKMSIGEHGFVSIVVDTEGNTIGLHSQK